MRKVLLLLLSLMVMQIPAFSINKKMLPSSGGENDLPNIFIYKIPDNEPEETKQEKEADEDNYINEKSVSSDENTDEEIMLDMSGENDEEAVLGATVLKGYAEYIEDAEAIYLKDDNKGVVTVRCKDIIFVEIQGRKTEIHTKEHDYLSKDGIKVWKARLNKSYFEIPHNSYIINTNFITYFCKEYIILDNKYTIPIAYSKRAEFKRKFMKIMGD